MKVKVDLKVCGVCGDKALGYNFNAVTCESCKAFFRRNALTSKVFVCPFNQQCEITTVTRRFCQKCRLDKCFQIGMCKQLIMSEQDKVMKRQMIEENRAKKRKHDSFKSRFKKIKSSGNNTNDIPNNNLISVINYNNTDIKTEDFNLLSSQNEKIVSSSDDISMLRNMLNTGSEIHQKPSESSSILSVLISTDEIYCNKNRNNLHNIQPFVTPTSSSNLQQTNSIALMDGNSLIEDETQDSTNSSVNVQISSADELSNVSSSEHVQNKTSAIHIQSSDNNSNISSSYSDSNSDNIVYNHERPSERHTIHDSTKLVPQDVTKDVVEDVHRVTVQPNSIESIMCEAIKLEFEAYSSIPQCKSNSRELNDAERAKLNELIVANKALLTPFDDDLNNLVGFDCKVKPLESDPALLDVINLTALFIRRLIKMTKKINAFKNMCQEDQVALLKGGCTEVMLLLSCMNLDSTKQTWQIPRTQENLKVNIDILKLAPGNVYQEHQKFLKTFDPKWRSDENIVLILCAITLFTPERPRVVHQDVIKLEQNSYYYLLRRYLESIYPGCEAKSTFLKLIQKIAELHRVNEELINAYLDVNPSQVEPLLIEIFDLNH